MDIITSVKKKRKRVVLTIEQKLKIIEKLKKGAKRADLAKEYNVGESTITDIKKREIKLTEFAVEMDCVEASETRKVARLSDNPKLDRALKLWFIQERSKGCPISGPILMEKAQIFNDNLQSEGNPNFKASTGFLK